MKALCQLESLLPPCASCHVVKIAFLQWSRLICSCRLLCSPWRSCVQYLYNSPWLFKMRKKSGGSGCRPRVFLFGITTLLEDQRESGALCLLMGRSPPTGSSTTCVHSLLPFNPQLFLISPSLLSHVSETSLNFMPPPHPPAPSISFLPSSSCVLVLNTTRTRTWVSGGAGASYITL